MGLLDEYGLDLDEVVVPSYDIKDDTYDFVVGDIYIRKGTENKPDDAWVCIDFIVGDEGKTKTEWFSLPKDASAPTDKELQKLGYYKQRILSLGVDEADVNTFESSDIIGVTGTLVLLTKNGYQNIRSLQIDDSGENQFAEAETEEVAPKAAAKAKAPAAKAAVKPKAATVVDNPFA